MLVICDRYLCVVDTIDGGLREYHKDKIYTVNKQNDYFMIEGFPLSEKQIVNNFIMVYEYKNNLINKILDE